MHHPDPPIRENRDIVPEAYVFAPRVDCRKVVCTITTDGARVPGFTFRHAVGIDVDEMSRRFPDFVAIDAFGHVVDRCALGSGLRYIGDSPAPWVSWRPKRSCRTQDASILFGIEPFRPPSS